MKKPNLVLDDYLVGFSAVLFMTAHWSTMAIRGYIFETAPSAASAEALFAAMEANPVAEHIFQLGNLGLVFSYLILPALVLTTYIMFRRTLGKKNHVLRGNIALTFFIVAWLDATNDLAFLAGLLA